MKGDLANLRAVIKRLAEHEGTGVVIRAGHLSGLIVILTRAADEMEFLKTSKEIEMGKASQAITELQGQLTTAQANAYDAADLAAIQSVLDAPATTSTTTATADTVASSTGGDTAAAANASSGTPVANS